MMQKEKLSEYRITGLYGHGSTDQDGEWRQSDNGGYMYIQNTCVDCKHNYHVDIRPNISESGFVMYLYLCLDACNSDNFLLCRTKFKTLKECKWFAVEYIKDYEASDKFDKIIIPKLESLYKPVYTYVNGKSEIVGQTIFGCFSDVSGYDLATKQFRYYHKDLPNYYSLVNWNNRMFFHEGNNDTIHYVELNGGSRCSSCLRGDEYSKVRQEIDQIKERLGLKSKVNEVFIRYDLTTTLSEYGLPA